MAGDPTFCPMCNRRSFEWEGNMGWCMLCAHQEYLPQLPSMMDDIEGEDDDGMDIVGV